MPAGPLASCGRRVDRRPKGCGNDRVSDRRKNDVRVLQSIEGRPGQSASEICASLGLSSSTLHGVLTRLRSSGRISRDAAGRYYAATEDAGSRVGVEREPAADLDAECPGEGLTTLELAERLIEVRTDLARLRAEETAILEELRRR